MTCCHHAVAAAATAFSFEHFLPLTMLRRSCQFNLKSDQIPAVDSVANDTQCIKRPLWIIMAYPNLSYFNLGIPRLTHQHSGTLKKCVGLFANASTPVCLANGCTQGHCC